NFGGHSTLEDIKEVINKINPKNIIINHGDINSGNTLRKSIDKKYNVLFPDIEDMLFLQLNGRNINQNSNDLTGLIFIIETIESLELLKNKIIELNIDSYEDMLIFIAHEKLKDKILEFEDELTEKGIAVDSVFFNNKLLKSQKETIEMYSEIFLKYEGDIELYIFEKAPQKLVLPIFLMNMLFNNDTFYINENNIINLPDFPIDFDLKQYGKYRNEIHNVLLNDEKSEGLYKKLPEEIKNLIEKTEIKGYVLSDYGEIIEDVYYMRNLTQIHRKNRQIPKITIKKIIEIDKKIKFPAETLWGHIESIEEIRNEKVLNFFSVLIEKIKNRIGIIRFINHKAFPKYHETKIILTKFSSEKLVIEIQERQGTQIIEILSKEKRYNIFKEVSIYNEIYNYFG
ncbi:RNA-metabolising metallo-beta-lactamase, partial [Marinitoga hydrogenitolerans DSM 16785]